MIKKVNEPIKIEMKQFGPSMKVEERSHPCFGQIQISRVSGRTELYGSSIEHHEFISLKILPSVTHIDGEQERYYAHSLPFIEVFMSQVQFAEAITSFNIGSGVPCTIVWNNNQSIDVPKLESKNTKHHVNFKERMKQYAKNLSKTYEDIKTLFGKNPMPKKDKETVLRKIEFALQEIESNIPYFEEQFAEEMNRTIMEAKGEVDAFMTATIHKIGIEGLEDHFKHIQIGNKKDEEEESKE